jgi:hypothetical protein
LPAQGRESVFTSPHFIIGKAQVRKRGEQREIGGVCRMSADISTNVRSSGLCHGLMGIEMGHDGRPPGFDVVTLARSNARRLRRLRLGRANCTPRWRPCFREKPSPMN